MKQPSTLSFFPMQVDVDTKGIIGASLSQEGK